MNSRVAVFVNGERHDVPADISVAAVLMSVESGQAFRHTQRSQEPRALFCGMGVCFDCLVMVDDRADVRACMTTVSAGMRIITT